MKRKLTFLSVWLASIVMVFAEEPPRVVVGTVSGDFQLDGRLNEAFWKDAPVHSGFHTLERKQQSDALGETTFQVVLHGDTLVIGVRCKQSAEEGSVRARERGNPALCNDDAVEVFLSPGGDGFYQFVVNAEGYVFDQWAAAGSAPAWNGVAWEAATFRDKDEWSVEIAIPLAALNRHGDISPEGWRFNIARTWGRNKIYQSWAPVEKGYAEVERHGILEFNPPLASPVALPVGTIKFPPLQIGKNEFSIDIPAKPDTEYSVKTSLREWQPGALPERVEVAKVTASPQGVLRVPLAVPLEKEETLQELIVELAEDNKPVCLLAHTFRAPRMFDVSIPRTVYFPGDGHIPLSVALRVADLRGSLRIVVTNPQNAIVHEETRPLSSGTDFSIPLKGLETGMHKVEAQADLDGIGRKTWRGTFLFVPGPFDEVSASSNRKANKTK